jgi:hypothetical protein
VIDGVATESQDRHEETRLVTEAPGSSIAVVAVTGGPGGGKSFLLERAIADARLRRSFVVTEEAIHGMRFVRMHPRSPEFQCALVAIQAATEASLRRALVGTGRHVILCHRGTLDPCAFWQSFGNSRESFFEMTGTTLEDHYGRYDLVLHLESAAVRVPTAYIRFPEAHRPEAIKEAAGLDRLLGELWCGHPRYVKIEATPDVEEKLSRAMAIITDAVSPRDDTAK